MRKRNYKSENIKSVNLKKMNECIEGKKLTLGIDIAKKKCFGRLMDNTFEVYATITWDQFEQTCELIEWIKQIKSKTVVVMESSSTYGDALRYQLHRHDIGVYQVSTKRCHDAREVYDGVPSIHDAKAADIIARLHIQGVSQRWEIKSEEQRERRSQLDLMCIYDKNYYRYMNQLESQLARYWPELGEVVELSTATVLDLLIYYGDPRLVVMNEKEAKARMRRKSRGLLSEAKISRIIESARNTYGMAMVRGERGLIKGIASEANEHRNKYEEIKKEIEAKSTQQEDIRNISEVTGKVTASALISMVGSPLTYESASSYEKAVGLNISEYSSGTYQGRRKISKRGSGISRWYLYLASLRLIQKDQVVRAWYEKKVDRDGGTHKGKAIIAVMRKLIKAIFHVAKGEAFNSRLLFDTTKLCIG